MGKAKSRRGESAAPVQDSSPSPRKRRRGKRAHAKPPRRERPDGQSVQQSVQQSLQTESTASVRLRESVEAAPRIWSPASARMNEDRVEAIAPAPAALPVPDVTDVPVHTAGPSFRQDIPRPPLRALLLVIWRHGVLRWRRGALRARMAVARMKARAVARLDTYVWQPVMWPFRPAQRELLARTLALLSVAIVATGWIAAYNSLTPRPVARPAAARTTPPKPFTAHAVSPALPRATRPTFKAPAVYPPHW